jgi:hypothetical protein
VSGSVPPRSLSTSLDAEALALAMAVAPTAYSRNKMFALFSDPRVSRARSRARLVRSLATELARCPDARVTQRTLANDRVQLTVQVERLQYTRNVELSRGELSAVAFLCDRAKTGALPCEPHDRALVERILSKLAAGLIG